MRNQQAEKKASESILQQQDANVPHPAQGKIPRQRGVWDVNKTETLLETHHFKGKGKIEDFFL